LGREPADHRRDQDRDRADGGADHRRAAGGRLPRVVFENHQSREKRNADLCKITELPVK
jgi:hypothetical protein